jgi:hypothetical protein
MADTPEGSGEDLPGPLPLLTNPIESVPGDEERDRKPAQVSLIPRKYRGFIPLAVIILVMAALLLVSNQFPEGAGGSEQSPDLTLSGTPIPTSSQVSATQPASSATQVTVTATASPTSSGSPDFTLTTSPASVSAGRGETVTYTMVIDGQNGFASPVILQLTASALLVSQTYDFGTYHPPFPQTIQYPFIVPDYLPPGVTVEGTLTATSGDLVHENRLTLRVT